MPVTKNLRRIFASVLILSSALLLIPAGMTKQSSQNTEWPAYGNDPAGSQSGPTSRAQGCPCQKYLSQKHVGQTFLHT
jgi:hypothetical protein